MKKSEKCKVRALKCFLVPLTSSVLILAFSCGKQEPVKKNERDVSRAVYTKYFSPSGGSQAEWGTFNCHDPKIFQDDDGKYYVYSTDASVGNAHKNGLQIRVSDDLVNWECLPFSALDGNWDSDWLLWCNQKQSNATTWAPTVIKQNELYYMYHGLCVDFPGHQYPNAIITLAISESPTGPFYPASEAAQKNTKIASVLKSLGVEYKQSTLVRYAGLDPSDDPFSSEDLKRYPSFNTSSYDTENEEDYGMRSWANGFGAIDPEFVFDVATGKLVEYEIASRKCYALTYGSWKGGIALMYVDALSLKPVSPSGDVLDVPADSEEYSFGTLIAGGSGAAYEGAQVIFNSETGYYYIFVSMGDLSWEYRVGVGRAENIEGPYEDPSGKSMTFSLGDNSGAYHAFGGKILGAYEISGEYGFRAQGGESIIRSNDGKILFAAHSRTTFNPEYNFFLQIHQMFFTKDGWPILNCNEYYNDFDGKDEGLEKLSVKEIAGTYDMILTERGEETGTVQYFGNVKQMNQNVKDATPKISEKVELKSNGKISGAYKGTWTLQDDGYSVTLKLKDGRTFTGYALQAVDWARKGNSGLRKTITITSLDSEKTGEYLWGNKSLTK